MRKKKINTTYFPKMARLSKIDQLLNSGIRYNKHEIIKRLSSIDGEISEPAFEKYIYELRHFYGAPIKFQFTKGRKGDGYYMYKSPYSFKDVLLDTLGY